MTKKTTEPMSLQKMFDTAAVGMLRQGKKSVDRIDTASCAYRGSGGCKCAVGFLIPDDLYSPSIEGASIEALNHDPDDDSKTQIALRNLLRRMKIDDDGRMHLLEDLQEIHDGVLKGPKQKLREDWYGYLKEVANAHQLSTKSIDKVMKELTEASA